MKMMKKKKKMDYLSELPDNILSTITSMLDIRDAGKTSVLSKRWRYVWINRPDFTFDHINVLGLDYYQLRENWEGKDTLFVNSVDQIMQQWIKGSTTIKSFRLWFWLGKNFSPYIDRWIGYALRNGLEILDLDLDTFYSEEILERYEFSLLRIVSEIDDFQCGSSFQKFESLVSLRLEKVDISNIQLMEVFERCPWLEKLGLSHCSTLTKLSAAIGNNNLLKVLDLKYLEISSFELMKFIKCCPLLEELTIENCDELTNLKICDSNNARMKILALKFCSNLNEIDLCVSHLHTLQYISNEILPSCKIIAPRLVNACILGNESFDPFTRSCLDNPMLENLVLLTIDSFLFSKSQVDRLPEFRNVRQLFLPDFSISISSSINCILKCFPMLQTLGLNTSDDLADYDLEDFDLEKDIKKEIEAEGLEECCNETITKLELDDFYASSYQVDFLKYLLKVLTGLKLLAFGSSHELYNVTNPKIRSCNTMDDPEDDIWLKGVLRQIVPPWLPLEFYE